MSSSEPFGAIEMGADPSIRSLVLRLMDSTGLNQRDFARRWGVSESMLSKLLTGKQQDILLDQAKKLVEAFGVNPKVLFEEREGNGAAN
jgi:antitoxin component HigA of HigAB toxin-antitoxin module